MSVPLVIRQLNRLRAQLDATGVTVGFRSVGGALEPVWPDGAVPTDAERAKVDAVFATFKLDDDAAQKEFDAAAEIDAVSDAYVAVAIAAAKLVAAAGAGESVAVEAVRATAKTDRRNSRRALR